VPVKPRVMQQRRTGAWARGPDGAKTSPRSPAKPQRVTYLPAKQSMKIDGPDGKPMVAPSVYVKVKFDDKFDKENGVEESAWYKSEGEARALAREYLGKNPVEVEKNKWRNVEGTWQYRAKPVDYQNGHVHLEQLDVSRGVVVRNLHLRWKPETGRNVEDLGNQLLDETLNSAREQPQKQKEVTVRHGTPDKGVMRSDRSGGRVAPGGRLMGGIGGGIVKHR
jgi:hypothetical protein